MMKLFVLPALLAISSPALAQRDSVRLTYLGTAGWEITDGKTVVIVDPYFSRLKDNTPNDRPAPEDTRPQINQGTLIVPDTAVINAHVRRADYILITHTHPDHALDMPYIARKTGAMVIGTASTGNLTYGGSLIVTNTGGALAAMNQTRSDLGIPLWNASNSTEAWGALKRERGIQLWLEARRLGDLHRWREGNVPGDVEDMTSRSTCFPIGQTERDANPNF